MWTNFVNQRYYRAFILDTMDNSHPIEVDVNTPEEALQMFDSISYGKGSSIIRMIENY